MKLARTTKDKCGMLSCTVDNELLFLHDNSGILKAVMCIHVDDLKITGSREMIIWLLSMIEKEFGKLKIDWHAFTNCGVRHIQDPTTFEVTLDQTEYISGISVVVDPGLRNRPSDDYCTTQVHEQFCRSLAPSRMRR